MDPPKTYNSSTQSIRTVDPDSLWTLGATTLPSQAEDVGTTLASISSTWNELKLSWFGGTADEAKRFNDDWLTAIDRLFGPADPEADVAPGHAILSRIAVAAATAASNFGNGEDTVIRIFKPFVDPSSDGSGEGSGDDSRDYDDGPITENTP